MNNIYTIKDELAGVFSAELMITKNDMVACRNFSDWCRNEKSPLYAHPENYKLYCLGTYDEDTGKINAVEPIEVAKATNYTVNKQIN